jgi:hypothetical protein
LLDGPPSETILSHIWVDVNDIEDLDDPFCSLNHNYICGDSIETILLSLPLVLALFMREEEVRALSIY